MNDAPICKKCRNQAVKVNAGIFNQIWYWYCRNCKIEVNNYGWEVETKKEEIKEISWDDNQHLLEEFFLDFDTTFNK